VSRSLPTDLAYRDQVVQYRDVGTKLTVKPTISVDGSVQLSVTQEVSSATTEMAFNAPVISNRSIRTELLVRDGQTVALGGLSDKQNDTDQGGFPLLSKLPFLGGFFGHASHRNTETELVIFITPRVIRTDDVAAVVTDSLRRKADKDRP
jgi:general secretion pathway protein D